MPAKYSFRQLPDGTFELHEDGFFSLKFKRNTIRDDFERFASRYQRSSKWIGSIIHLFHRAFPLPPKPSSGRIFLSEFQKEEHFVSNFRNRGFHVYKPSPTPDEEMLEFLEGRGWAIEGNPAVSPYMMGDVCFSRN